ncbi:gfo/Idh/MocA family oxidoreductase [candidate division KSB3 bacterium]|uniref:Gfo/Idh/MocA family oxidoreductase n=1 Tax=candidate division KSB3 bacterium TaxID=2044937 RepID=A0A9D5Q615_9BACT|nr:gfo/Idh/MocA family oxidoreductase [candidate division KSB3 bacterium]MBD3324436.1 gfo/Idh/MocA family oxidoreductase [candidate division KSB3 bacterium]
METIGYGIIGGGLWGETHARIMASHPFAELIGVCDLREDRAKQISDQYGAKTYYTDYQEMLKEPDIQAVGIVTPDFAHCGPFVAACQAGKHILVEKPLGTTHDDLQTMRRAYEAAKVRVMVDFHARWNPPFVVARDNIRDQQIGDLISMYYRLNDTIFVPTGMLSWAAKSSILWFLGSHTVDTLRFFAESEVRRVYSVSRSEVLVQHGIDVPDIYQSILEFDSGVIATIENNWIIPNSNPHWNDIKLNILGSKGMFNMDLTGNQAIERYLEEKSDHPDILIMPTIHGKPTGFAYESIRDFIERLVSGEEFISGFEDGYRVSKVILAIMHSAETRQPVDVVYD